MKTVIDLDSDLVEQAAGFLGKKTKKDTVHAALTNTIAIARQKAERRRRLLNSAGGPDLGNDAIMDGTWR